MLVVIAFIIIALRPNTATTRSLPRGETPVPSTWRATDRLLAEGRDLSDAEFYERVENLGSPSGAVGVEVDRLQRAVLEGGPGSHEEATRATDRLLELCIEVKANRP